MIRADFHTHSTYCDGKCSLKEMAESAYNMGLKTLGFSGHAYTEFEAEWCMSPTDTVKYIDEVKALREEYKGLMDIRLGTEWDYFSSGDKSPYDYIIGSVHNIAIGEPKDKDGNYIKENIISIDESKDKLIADCNKYFDGDYYSLIASYYSMEESLIDNTGADIIGHFDLITKFNEGYALFDEENERYIRAARKAADALLESNKIFELNTGAISRGYRSFPYPGKGLIDYIGVRGGKFILSSDAHEKGTICYKFDVYEEYLRAKGYTLLKDYKD